MKIRYGFVSNSSSSSFVLKGFIVDNIYDAEDILKNHVEYTEESFWTLLKNLNLKMFCSEDINSSDKYMIGKKLTESDNEYLPITIADCSLDEDLIKLKDAIEKTTNKTAEVKILAGTIYC